MSIFKDRDNIHFSFRSIDGYDIPFNYCITPREPGKTTSLILDKAYIPFKNDGLCFIMLTRFAADITEEVITNYQEILDKFLVEPVKITYKLADIGKKAIFDTFIDGKRFIRFIAMNGRIDRIKKTGCNNVGFMGMDEFIINPKFKESYLPNEYEKFQEIYTTYQRGCRNADGSKRTLKTYFCGNLYSAFNPYFTHLGVKTNSLKINNFYKYGNSIIQFSGVSEELRKQILATNPFYEFDEEYKKYALEGIAVNDINIRLGELPQNYKLDMVVAIDNKFIGIYRNNQIRSIKDDRYFVQFVKEFSLKRDIYCFDFSDMVNQTILISNNEKMIFRNFKNAFRNRLITFSEISCYYYLEGIYSQI